MANWVTKYKLEFSDTHIYTPADWRVELKYVDYSGDIIPLTGAADPLIITHGEDTNDRTKNIIGSSIQLNIIIKDNGFDVSDFFNVEAQSIKCDIYKDSNLYWSGFIITDFLEYPRTNAPYELSITGTDGISDLKSKSGNWDFLIYTKDASGPLDNEGYQFVNIIDFFTRWGVWDVMDNIDKTILRSTLTTGLIDGRPIYNQLLDECAVLIDFWIDEEDETKYRDLYECLEIICRSFGFRIFVEDGNLFIQHIAEMGHNYNSVGIYSKDPNNTNVVVKEISTSDYSQLLGSDSSSTEAIYMNNDTVINIYPPLKKTSFDIDYIPRNWLRNSRWLEYTEGPFLNDFDYWEAWDFDSNSPYDGVSRGGSGKKYDPYYARMQGQANKCALYQDIPIFDNWTDNLTLELSFKIRLTVPVFNYEIFVLDENKNEIGYLGSANAGGIFNNLHTPRQWVFHEIYGSDWRPHSEDSRFSNPHSLADNNDFINISLSTKTNIWDSTYLTTKPKFFRLYFWDNDGGHIDIFPVDFNIYHGVKKDGEIDKFESRKNYIKTKKIENAKLITGTEFEANSIYLTEENDPLDQIIPLHDVLINGYLTVNLQYVQVAFLESMQAVPYKVLKGTFYSNKLKFHHVIQQAVENDRYLQMFDEYHVKTCSHSMTLAQIFDFVIYDENYNEDQRQADPFNTVHFYSETYQVRKYKIDNDN